MKSIIFIFLKNDKYDTEKNLFSCAGVVEKDDYQRVIVTFIKQAKQKDLYAATVAVSLFEEIAECMLIHKMSSVKGLKIGYFQHTLKEDIFICLIKRTLSLIYDTQINIILYNKFF